ncbi:CRISPR-associated protein, Csy4 family [Nitrosomonas aestuarii]|uniref:CRISPR-associated protein, Csy4 family n=1 Tax=Nitrosomonas aestuarii TaxID=52441 RepID=A0A1I4E149_9PROT|nr:type I-F CRISPR-associated endoribonuclease Cas6/Csy4 [Nitrosomonas aestuarii]SFK97851.1 CRISPR-associated protein, Csy4 family [Nitrosomonas aestuarii]
MNHYIDISILPDPEFPATVLMNSLYSKFHKVLYELHATTIGVSFPRHQLTLGNLLRVHGNRSLLYSIQQFNWIGAMSGYCKISEVSPVPTDTKFRTVSRKQTNMSNAKLNRLIKRGTITEQQVKNYKAKMFSKGMDIPYLELQSASNGHKHRRYIEFGELLDEPVQGQFDQFGLSKSATVPWFD